MKVITLHEAGLADKLVYEDVPKPAIDDNQVLVKIYASSVNHIDWKKAIGKVGALPVFPWIPGMDFVGKIERLGADVEGFALGDEVMGCCNGGSYAEYIAADPKQIVLKPTKLSYIDAASSAFVAQVAWQAVNDHGKLMKGQRVLIHGGAGAVGAYAVQFAKLLGADVYVTAAANDRDFVESLGADVFIDYRRDNFVKIARDMDLVIDTVGGETGIKSYDAVKHSGRLVSLTMPVDKELSTKRAITAVYMGVKTNAEDLRIISKLLGEGRLVTDIAAVFWLSEAHDAWEYQLSSDADKRHGKVVLQVV